MRLRAIVYIVSGKSSCERKTAVRVLIFRTRTYHILRVRFARNSTCNEISSVKSKTNREINKNKVLGKIFESILFGFG